MHRLSPVNVKRRLKRLGKTQQDLADALLIDRSYISKLIHGHVLNCHIREIREQLDLWEQEKRESYRLKRLHSPED